MVINVKLEEPQPITGEIKDMQKIVDRLNQELQRAQRNIRALIKAIEEAS